NALVFQFPIVVSPHGSFTPWFLGANECGSGAPDKQDLHTTFPLELTKTRSEGLFGSPQGTGRPIGRFPARGETAGGCHLKTILPGNKKQRGRERPTTNC